MKFSCKRLLTLGLKRDGIAGMPTALERIAAYSGKISPDQVVTDCKEVRDQGPKQAIELMRQALTTPQITAVIAKAKRHLAKLLEARSAETPPSQIDGKPIADAYTVAKGEARTALAGQAEAEQVKVTTRVVAEACAQCHVAALELLSILDNTLELDDDGSNVSATADTSDLTRDAAAAQSMIGQPTDE